MLNRCVLMGRLVADAELKRTASDISVTSFTIAVDRGYVRPGEERQADFIDCVAWRQTAEFISKWFSKGSMIAIEGKLQTRMWEDKQGNKRKSVEVVIDNAFFAESKKSSQGGQSMTSNSAPAPFSMDAGGNQFSELEIDDGELPF